jgi:hypothetical protein
MVCWGVGWVHVAQNKAPCVHGHEPWAAQNIGYFMVGDYWLFKGDRSMNLMS